MTPFNPQHGLIIVRVKVSGPNGQRVVRLAVDTGPSVTVISKEILVILGYAPDAVPKTVRFTTGSRTESASRATVEEMETPGQ